MKLICYERGTPTVESQTPIYHNVPLVEIPSFQKTRLHQISSNYRDSQNSEKFSHPNQELKTTSLSQGGRNLTFRWEFEDSIIFLFGVAIFFSKGR